MNYAYRKIFTVSDGTHEVITPTVGSTITFDSSKTYDVTQMYFGNVGLFLCGVNGYPEYLEGDTLIVVSYDPTNTTNIGDPNYIFVSECTIEYVCPSGIDSTFKSYFDLTGMLSDRAYAWAVAFGDPDDVINYVTDQGVMSYWVAYVRYSDYSRFAPSITDQQWIYYWATQFDDSSFFDKLTDNQYLFQYAMYFPSRESLVKPKLTDPVWIDAFNQQFPDDQINTASPTPTPTVTGTVTPTVTTTNTPTLTATSTITPTPSVTETPTTI